MGLVSETRPWGSWHVLEEGDGYKVKRLHVTPGCRLSYQRHEQRAEHWVVVSGVATCTVDGDEFTVQAGGCVDVPLGAKHRLANDGDVELTIIEVQRGPYTGEDDIERFEDDYGRSD